MLGSDWLKAFVAVGVLRSSRQWTAVGAGVLFLDDDQLLWLATAAHVVNTAGRENFAPLFLRRDGGPLVLELRSIQREAGFDWIVDAASDLAVSPLPSVPEADIKAVTRDLCISIRDVAPSMPAYTVGCPYGVHALDPARPGPLVLDGVVSGIDLRAGVIYTSAPTFPGNSGGPLVVYRNPVSASGNLTLGDKPILLAGVMLETLLVPAPEAREGDVRMPPLHLGVARTVDSVVNLVASAEARKLASRLRTTSSPG